MTANAQDNPAGLIPNWRTGEDAFTRLPRGNHHISRDDVVASQKGRIVRATLELIGEEGPASVSISEVARRAKVSRKTYYSIFRSSDECLNQAFVTAHLILGFEIARAVEQADMSKPYPRLRAMITEFFEMAIEEPVLATAIVGSPVSTKNGLGPIWLDVRNAQMQIMNSYWAEDCKQQRGKATNKASESSRLAAIALISATIMDALAGGQQDQLRTQVDEVLNTVVLLLNS